MASTKPSREQAAAEAFLQKKGQEPFRQSDLADVLIRFWGQFSGNAARSAAKFIKAWRTAGRIEKAGHIHWRASNVTLLDVVARTRRTKAGRILQELSSPVELKVTTLVPEKWVIVDLETGQTYQGTNQGLKPMEAALAPELLAIAQQQCATKD